MVEAMMSGIWGVMTRGRGSDDEGGDPLGPDVCVGRLGRQHQLVVPGEAGGYNRDICEQT